jgi:hypothetical protein
MGNKKRRLNKLTFKKVRKKLKENVMTALFLVLFFSALVIFFVAGWQQGYTTGLQYQNLKSIEDCINACKVLNDIYLRY